MTSYNLVQKQKRQLIFSLILAAGLTLPMHLNAQEISASNKTVDAPICQKNATDIPKEKTIVAKLPEKVAKALDDVGFEANLNFVQILFHGLSNYLRGGYKLIVGPSFEGNLITREDNYYFEITHDFIIAQLKRNFPAFFDLGVDAAVEGEFDRQFNDPCLANDLSSRYGESDAPFTAEVARHKLKVGDYFSFKTHWSLSPGFGVTKGIVVTASAGAHDLASGEFQFHFVKETDDKMRIKIVGLKSAGYSKTLLNISAFTSRRFSPIGFINGEIHRIFANILDLTWTKVAENVMMTEMIVDLSDQETRDAYDKMLAFTSENQEAINDLKHTDAIKVLKYDFKAEVATHLKTPIFINIEPLHELAKRHNPHVIEPLRLSDLVDSQQAPKAIGLTFIAGGKGTEEIEHHKISSLNVNNKQENFQSDSFHSKSQIRAELNYAGEINDQSVHLVSASNEDFKRTRFIELVSALELRKKQFEPNDLAQLNRVFGRAVTKDFYDQIQSEIQKNWANPDKEHRNAHSLIQVALHEEGLKALPEMNEIDIREAFKVFLKSVDLTGDEIVKVLLAGESLNEYMVMTSAEKTAYAMDHTLRPSIDQIAKLLAITFKKSGVTLDEKAAAFSELQSIPLFVHAGSGFMMTLLPQDQLDHLVKINVVLEDADKNRAEFLFGKTDIDPIYVEILKVQSILNDSGHDLKLEGIKLVTRPGSKPTKESITAPYMTKD